MEVYQSKDIGENVHYIIDNNSDKAAAAIRRLTDVRLFILISKALGSIYLLWSLIASIVLGHLTIERPFEYEYSIFSPPTTFSKSKYNI
jgi:hypothetical protein